MGCWCIGRVCRAVEGRVEVFVSLLGGWVGIKADGSDCPPRGWMDEGPWHTKASVPFSLTPNI